MNPVNKKKNEFIHKINYYVLLVLLILFITGFVFLMTPLIVFADPIITYLMLTLIGLSFGLFIGYFAKDLDHLTSHHQHTEIWVSTLIASTINFFAITGAIQLASFNLELEYPPSAVLALIFTASFIIPYFLVVNEHHTKKGRTWLK